VGLSADGTRWIACRPDFFLPVRVLSRLFRRLFLDGLLALHEAGRLAFFGEAVGLARPDAFAAHLASLRKTEWVVYAKRPLGGPEAVLAYLSRDTHRVAISNSRLIAADDQGVTFRWKDYRARGKAGGQDWIKTMTLEADEFIRRFLIHVLPSGFHRIRHYGLLASAGRRANVARTRELLAVTLPRPDRVGDGIQDQPEDESRELRPCPCCGGRMLVIETFDRGFTRARAPSSRSTAHDLVRAEPRRRTARPTPAFDDAMDDLDPTRPGTQSSTTRGASADPRSGPWADCVSSSAATLPAIRPPRTANTPTRPATNPIVGATDGRCGHAVSFPGGFQTPAVNPVAPASTAGI